MKTFAEWIKAGPLADEKLTDRERTMLNVAYNEAAMQANDQNRAALERILQGAPDERRVA
jgi:hypothetical protein